MRTFGDAVWWTCSTLATVGYGDITPSPRAGGWSPSGSRPWTWACSAP
ncbi:potassium channel family protein [Streptomyces regalis]